MSHHEKHSHHRSKFRIGKATAKYFAAQGWKVAATMREQVGDDAFIAGMRERMLS